VDINQTNRPKDNPRIMKMAIEGAPRLPKEGKAYVTSFIFNPLDVRSMGM
jgi:hypothetical protein